MATRISSRRQIGPRSSSLQHDDENGLSKSMHEVKNHRAVSQAKKSSERAQRSTTPTRSNGNKEGNHHRNLAPSTPTDPRSSSRMGKSFMSPTNASASRMAAIEPIRTSDVYENAASDISPSQGPGPQSKKGKRTPVPNPAHLKGDVRTPNGIVSRTQAQKPLTRTQRLDEASLRKLQNARTIQSNAQTRNRAKVSQPKKLNKPQEQRNVRKNIPLARGRAQSPLEMVVQPHGSHDQTTAFGMSAYGKAREDDFYFPGAFLPEVPERTSSSPGRGVKSSWGLPSLSMFSSSPPKPDINVEAIVEHNKHLEGAVFHWRQENMKLNEDLKQLREVNEQHESDLRELQTKSFKEISKSIWSPLEDQVVRETLETIHKEIEDWAEENCIKTFNDVDESCMSNEDAGSLLEFLKDIASTDSENLWGQFQVWRGQQIDPELIFTAVITSCMYDQVFRNPFTVLDAFEVQESYDGKVSKQSEFGEDQYEHQSEPAEDQPASVQNKDQLVDEEYDEYLLKEFFALECGGTETDSDAGESGPEYQEDENMEDADNRAYEHDGQQPSSPKPSAVMLETYHTLKRLNLEQSQLWRSQLMKILFPTPKSSSRFDALSPTDQRITSYLRSHCTALVDNFLRSPARIFLRCDPSEESKSSLIDCWERTIHIFTQLQTQLRLVEWTMPEKLPLVGKLFDGQCMDGHCTQTYVSKDKVPISLVVSPAIMLVGNEDGQHYNVERVVVKAIVRVDEDEEL